MNMKKFFASAMAVLATTFMFNTTTLAAEDAAPAYVPTYELEIYQPMVQLENKTAQCIINNYMLDFARQLPENISEEYLQYDSVCDVRLHSCVTYKSAKLVSIVTNKYTNMENSAHPGVYKYGRIFSTADGHALSLKELGTLPEFKDKAGHYNMDYIRAAIYNKYHNQLYSDREYLANLQMPQDVYLDENGNAHVIVQVYEVGPYAAGIIDVNLDVPEASL